MSGYESIIPMAISAASSIAGQVEKSNDQGSAADAQTAAWERENQMVAAQQAVQNRQRQSLLEQRQASLRANMGALGVGGNGGSVDAILAGMAGESAQDSADSSQLARLKLNTRRSNLLDRSRSSGGMNPMSVFTSFYGGSGGLDDTGGMGDLGGLT